MSSSTRLDQNAPVAASRTAAPAEEDRPVLAALKTLQPGTTTRSRLTVPQLRDGEQYRFHFDMTRCIGCRSCEVACNEQNNNPPEVNWRRVGEIEGGSYPNVARLHLSMACNHCLEPSCLEGCPVDAYTKLANGIVAHDAETCIGCQYCTWNCPYGVPQYHPERRVVTKCHMCVDRLADGAAPACVGACPTSAIEIESVDVAEWRDRITAADAPGVPPSDLTLSTTRITLPEELPASVGDVDARLLEPEAPHWSLVFFLVLGQWSTGLFFVAPFFLADPTLGMALCLSGFLVGHVSLATALLHLGRPVHALRAMKAWRHSWLSREVIAFLAYSIAALLPLSIALGRWLDPDASSFVLDAPAFVASSLVTGIVGLAGIACSVGIYRIPARPSWDSLRTPVQFFGTAALLGAVTAVLATRCGVIESPDRRLTWTLASLVSILALVQLVAPWQLALQGLTTRDSPLRGSAILMTRHFRRLFHSRVVLFFGVVSLAVTAASLKPTPLSIVFAAASLTLAVVSEIIGRYLFFVTVVPRNMPGSFFASRPTHG